MASDPAAPSSASAPPPAAHHTTTEGSVIETIQSLIVAFVLAMTFRGFVVEGFVIPTGSMAPTLMGQHRLIHSPQTGVEFPVGMDQEVAWPAGARPRDRLADPMLGPRYAGSAAPNKPMTRRMGDRILVLKSLYPFAEPRRFDVVVFKNPTDPVGEAQNYIKRLIGLPNEHIWLADGDVFSKRADDGEFRIQRKPEHVQRAVWQKIHHSDYVPINPDRLLPPYKGPPWIGEAWDTTGRAYRCDREASVLRWNHSAHPIDDWTPYNSLAGQSQDLPTVSDVRVSAAIVPDRAELSATFELTARSHVFQFRIGNGQATVRMRRAGNGELAWIEQTAACDAIQGGEVLNLECWHADQSLRLFINGREAVPALEYEWAPLDRLHFTTGDMHTDDVESLIDRPAIDPQMRWLFTGSPVTLHRVRVDRDLHYREDQLQPARQQKNSPQISGSAFGTHPDDNPAVLGPDQFMMLGDNSQMSLDSRLWGSPHPLVAYQIDSSPFIVNRRLLLGKAWVVYFPAMYPLAEGGTGVVPDFGRLRFIR